MNRIVYKLSSGKTLILGNQFDHRVNHVDFEDFQKIHEDSDVYLKIAGRGIFKLDGIGFDVTQRFTLENIKMVGQLMELHENPDGDLSTITPDDGQTLYENIVDNEAAVKRFDVIHHSSIFYMRVLESVDENTEIIESEYEYIFWRDRLNHIVSEIEEHIQNGDFDGEDGFSPIVSMEKSNGRLTLQITDKNGEHTAFISDGKDGESVGIDRIEESTEPEGISAVYFTDGKVLYIKNGKDGTDYVITAADKEEIAEIAKQKALDATYDKQTIDEKIAEATPEDYDQVKANVQNIQNVIPDQASEDNQLADKDFVNSSVANNTAFFIGVFNSVAELEAYSGTLTNNDYAFVIAQDADGNTLYKRYKYNASTAEWMFEFDLNNSSFTAAQWASIQSGITEALVEKLNGIEAGAQKNPADYASVKKQVEDNTSELREQKEDFSNGLNKKVGYSEVENGQLLMYSDDTKAVLLATLDLPIGGGNVDDVKVDGNSILDENKVANIPLAEGMDGVKRLGVIYANEWSNYGISIRTGGEIRTSKASDANITNRQLTGNPYEFRPITPSNLDLAVKSAMCDGKGAEWTSAEQLSARQRLGIENKFELIETITISADYKPEIITKTAYPNGDAYNFEHLGVMIDIPESPTTKSLNLTIYGENKTMLGYAYYSGNSSTSKKSARFMSLNLFGLRRTFVNPIVNYGSSANYIVTPQSNKTDDFNNNDNTIMRIVFNNTDGLPEGTIIKIYGVRA